MTFGYSILRFWFLVTCVYLDIGCVDLCVYWDIGCVDLCVYFSFFDVGVFKSYLICLKTKESRNGVQDLTSSQVTHQLFRPRSGEFLNSTVQCEFILQHSLSSHISYLDPGMENS